MSVDPTKCQHTLEFGKFKNQRILRYIKTKQ